MFALKAVLIIAGIQVWTGTRHEPRWDTLEACKAEAPAIFESDKPKFADFVAQNVGEGTPYIVTGECVKVPAQPEDGTPA